MLILVIFHFGFSLFLLRRELKVTAYNNALTRRHVDARTPREGRALGCEGQIKLEFDLSSNHNPSPGAKLRQEDKLCGSGSVMS